MTLKIEIIADPQWGPERDQLDAAMEALGFRRPVAPVVPVVSAPIDESGQSAGFDAGRPVVGVAPTVPGEIADQILGTNITGKPVPAPSDDDGSVSITPKRERGKPAPGRSRRTKEEIAEDEERDRLAAEGERLKTGLGSIATAAAADNPFGGQLISSDPENRVGPEDTPETEAQDKADEKAEVEANRAPAKPLTRDDVKAAMTAYVAAYGMEAIQVDGPKIFREALGEPPAGEQYWKLSLVPENDQAKLAKAVEIWCKATALNPLNRTKVS